MQTIGTADSVRARRAALDELYARYNRREFVHPDPLEFLYRYDEVRDREVAGLICSSLAFGRVKQILKSVSWVLERMGPSPFRFIMQAAPEAMRSEVAGFRHRFVDADDLFGLLVGVRAILERHGSLQACFVSGLKLDDCSVLPALAAFVEELTQGGAGTHDALLPRPRRGSACKRLNLFLRWMVRRDDVDPGGWEGVSPAKLIIPLDTHMHRISLALGLTRRRQADVRTAQEITSGFGALVPDDPVRYDFCLTRLGIRDDVCLDEFLQQCQLEETA